MTPDGVQQLLLGHQLTGAAHQLAQHLEGPRRQIDGAVVDLQPGFRLVDRESGRTGPATAFVSFISRKCADAIDAESRPQRDDFTAALSILPPMTLNPHPTYPAAGGYVLRLHRDACPVAGRLMGRIEHVASGEMHRFCQRRSAA